MESIISLLNEQFSIGITNHDIDILIKICSGESTPEEEKEFMDKTGLDENYIKIMKSGYNKAKKDDLDE